MSHIQCPTCEGQGVCGTQPRDPQQQEIWDCHRCDGTGQIVPGSEREQQFADSQEG